MDNMVLHKAIEKVYDTHPATIRDWLAHLLATAHESPQSLATRWVDHENARNVASLAVYTDEDAARAVRDIEDVLSLARLRDDWNPDPVVFAIEYLRDLMDYDDELPDLVSYWAEIYQASD